MRLSCIVSVLSISIWLIGPLAAQQSQAQELILPIVVNGSLSPSAQFVTTFSFMNISNTTTKVTTVMFDDAGKRAGPFCPGPIPPLDLSAISFELVRNGLVTFNTSAAGNLVSGWMRITQDPKVPIEAAAELVLLKSPPIFCPIAVCTRPSTEKIADVRVPAVKPAKEFRAEAVINKNRHSAFAIVNPSPTATATIDFALLDPAGAAFLRPTRFELEPNHRFAGFVWNLTTICPIGFACAAVVLPPPENFHGSVKITSNIPIAVAGVDVLFPEGKLVNLPVVATQ